MAAPVTFRPRSARVTAVIMVVIAAGVAVAHVAADGIGAAAPTIGLACLASVVAITAYWMPRVHVDAATVTIENVLSTVTVPLARVVHVDTRWALELHTDDGRKASAFAAPAPGAAKARNFRPTDLRGLPADTYATGSVRVGDSPGTASGDAAILVRTALATWRKSGERDDRTVSRRANVASAITLAAGACIAVLGFLL